MKECIDCGRRVPTENLTERKRRVKGGRISCPEELGGCGYFRHISQKEIDAIMLENKPLSQCPNCGSDVITFGSYALDEEVRRLLG